MRALIVEDNDATRQSLAELIEGEGFDVEQACSLSEARAHIQTATPHVVILDLKLPDGSGMDLVTGLEELEGEDRPEFLLVTGNASLSTAVEALRHGVADYLTKPIDIERLRSVLRGIERASELRREVKSLRTELRSLGFVGRLVGRSTAMEKVFDLVTRVAPTDATVLITGASGTGKEVVARTIHDLSHRANEPFVAVNCGAIAATIMESQLFGHERGAFTGADSRHHGFFEQADGGTLLLDEITEMPPELQVKLLRVLETRSFTRVGGEKATEVNVRVLAATNRDPERAVQDKLLRADLYYRLRVIRIHLPALLERRGDVRLLADHFLQRMNEETGQDKRFGDRTYEVLDAYPWPGNVRELKNALQSAHILSDNVIEPDHLPVELPETAEAALDATPGVAAGGGASIPVRVGGTIAEAEKRLIMATLEKVDGNRTQAAEILGVSVKTLYNRLKAYEEEDEQQ